MPETPLDCLIIGGGPAGLTAALYLARFRRRAVVVDAGDPRAAWIPVSHNIPFFADGIGGRDVLARVRAHAERYGARIVPGTVVTLRRTEDGFAAAIDGAEPIAARHVLLATGASDVDPALPDLPDAVRRGLVRYCPICDGYEAQGRRVAVLGRGARGLGEALFMVRTYRAEVTLLTSGAPLDLDPEQQRAVQRHGIRLVPQPIVALEVAGDRIAAVRLGGGEALRFDMLYSALGLDCRAELAARLGARRDEVGAVVIDEHCRTSVPRLYAAGGVARGLDQVVVAMGHAAVAATDIHNRCEPPTEDEGRA